MPNKADAITIIDLLGPDFFSATKGYSNTLNK